MIKKVGAKKMEILKAYYLKLCQAERDEDKVWGLFFLKAKKMGLL